MKNENERNNEFEMRREGKQKEKRETISIKSDSVDEDVTEEEEVAVLNMCASPCNRHLPRSS